MASDGVKVYYVTGNHDDVLRRYSDLTLGNIHLRNKLVLQLDGKQYWIFHGDVFDLFIHYSPAFTRLGRKGYDWLIRANRSINFIRAAIGKPRMSFAAKVKNQVKEAVRFISDFEETAIRLAEEKGFKFVICGHIHKPQIRQEGDVTYMNAGDWVENLTALEFQLGKWSVFEYDESEFEYISPRLKVKESPTSEDVKVSKETLLHK